MPKHIPHWAEKFGYGDFVRLEHVNCEACMMKGDKIFRKVKENCFETAHRITEMEETGVHLQVLSVIPVLFNYWAKALHGLETSQFFNDHIAGIVAKQPDKFLGLGTVPMQDTDLAIEEMERCMNELHLSGIEIGTNINGENLSEERLLPFFEKAQDLNCAIFVHPWQMMGRKEIQKYWLPWLVAMPAETSRAICSLIFGGVLEKFPNINFAFAHGGGSFPATLGRVSHGFEVRPDLCAVDNQVNPKEYLKKFWVDSLVHDAHALRFLTQMMGEDYVCLGSDYPFPLGEHHPGKLIESMEWEEKLKKKILFENALKWLNRKT